MTARAYAGLCVRYNFGGPEYDDRPQSGIAACYSFSGKCCERVPGAPQLRDDIRRLFAGPRFTAVQPPGGIPPALQIGAASRPAACPAGELEHRPPPAYPGECRHIGTRTDAGIACPSTASETRSPRRKVEGRRRLSQHEGSSAASSASPAARNSPSAQLKSEGRRLVRSRGWRNPLASMAMAARSARRMESASRGIASRRFAASRVRQALRGGACPAAGPAPAAAGGAVRQDPAGIGKQREGRSPSAAAGGSAT